MKIIFKVIFFLMMFSMKLYAFEVYKTTNGSDVHWVSGQETYVVNANGGPVGSINAIQSAAQTWANVPTSFFNFVYGGTTSSTAYGINDGVNLISFGQLTGSSVGENHFWYYTNTGEIIDSDIRFNTNYLWGLGISSSFYDVQNVATHEFGHSLSLNDLYSIIDSEKTMYGYTSYGETKRRTLHQDDINGITYLYPQHFNSSVTVTFPNGGEFFAAGSTNDIRWTSINITNVKLEYSIDNGLTWLLIIGSTFADVGSYTWSVPNIISPECYIKISDTSNSSIYDLNNESFNIVEAIRIVSPNGGERLTSGAQHNITWICSGIVNIKLEYSTDNGSSWTIIAPSINASNKNYPWSVPNISSSQCLVKISDTMNSSANDFSNAVFTIAGTVRVTSPNGGESLIVGTQHNITWASIGTTYIKIEYSTDNGSSWTTITENTSTLTGGYSWTVPNAPSKNYLIKISDTSNFSIYDVCDDFFTVAGTVKVTSPNGGESWPVGSNQNITWVSSSPMNVKLEYSINNGSTWATITETSANSYRWAIPNKCSSQCILRIVNTANSDVNDSSDSVFTIAGNIKLTSPIGGELWISGIINNVTWISENITNIKLEYSIDNGSLWSVLKESVKASDASYSWKVPNISSSHCLVKISDTSNSLVSDQSDSSFSIIIPALTLTSPNGGEKWFSGSANEITWTTENVDKIKLEYTLNNGSSWNLIASDISASLKTFTWTLPDTVSTQCLVRISDITNPEINDRSNAAFTIKRLAPPSSFVASDPPNDNGHTIQLTWTASPDVGTMDGYRIYRSRKTEFTEPVYYLDSIINVEELIEKEQTNAILIANLSNSVTAYTDNSVPLNGVDYYYWIQSCLGIFVSAKVQSGKITAVEKEIPVSFDVSTPYPNPFNPRTTISFSVPSSGYVSLDVYSLAGQKVATLVNGIIETGRHEVIFDGSGLASGVYLYRFESGGFSKTGKMLLMK